MNEVPGRLSRGAKLEHRSVLGHRLYSFRYAGSNSWPPDLLVGMSPGAENTVHKIRIENKTYRDTGKERNHGTRYTHTKRPPRYIYWRAGHKLRCRKALPVEHVRKLVKADAERKMGGDD